MAVRSVLIADSNTRLSRLVARLLDDEQGFRVVGVLDAADAVLKLAHREQPDLVLLSDRLEGRSVKGLCERLRRSAPDAVLVVWSHEPAGRGASEVGADACVERGTTFRRFLQDLRQVVGCHEAAPARATRSDEHRVELPPQPRTAVPARLRDEPDGGLLLSCDSCEVQMRLSTDDVAPAVDEARAFFVAHELCDTAIDLMERPALSAT